MTLEAAQDVRKTNRQKEKSAKGKGKDKGTKLKEAGLTFPSKEATRRRTRKTGQTKEVTSGTRPTRTPGHDGAGRTPRTEKPSSDLQQRVAIIEKTQATQIAKTTAVETRLTSVEGSVGSLQGLMQSNFDRLFAKFENMNEGTPKRKPGGSWEEGSSLQPSVR
eukprot:3686186-Amphidinium_carterae.7